MADYQKVEINQGEDSAPFSEEDLQGLEKESQEQEAAAEVRASEEAQREQDIVNENRPEWLPEKFSSAEDLVNAYSELESQFTKEKQDSPEGEEAPAPEPLSADTFNKYHEEFTETGDVSEESREAIVNMVLPREVIDAYIEGQKAVMDQQFNAVYQEVGGEANYSQMLEWATQNLPDGEQKAFNDAVVGGTEDQMMFAIKSLVSRWKGSGDVKPSLIQGNTGYADASGGFRSIAELTTAMKDPRYTKDPAYRKDIENRLSNSNIL